MPRTIRPITFTVTNTTGTDFTVTNTPGTDTVNYREWVDILRFVDEAIHLKPNTPPPERNDGMQDSDYFEFNYETNKLYLTNWINPKSDSKLGITVDLYAIENSMNNRGQLGEALIEATKCIRQHYPDMEIAEDTVLNGYFQIKPEPKNKNSRYITDVVLPTASIDYILNKLKEIDRNLDKDIGKNYSYLIDGLRKADSYHIYTYVNRLQEATLRKNNLRACLNAVHALQNDEIEEAYITESTHMVDFILKSLNKAMGTKGNINNPHTSEDKKIKYQFNYSVMRDRLQQDIDYIVKHKNHLSNVFGGYRPYPEAFIIRLKKYTTTTPKTTNINLNALYPSLKQDLKNLRDLERGAPFRPNPTEIHCQFDNLRHHFKTVNEIKNKLMLLGYSEYKAARIISVIGYKCDVLRCEITNQYVPSIFLVRTRLINGDIKLINAYYMIQQNNNSSGTNHFNWGRHVVEYVEELDLSARHKYAVDVKNYKYNVLDYLSVRSLPNENVNVCTKDKNYRPVPYLGIELEVERRENCPEEITTQTLESLGKDYIILKRDGSLAGHLPFEIVTVPATLNYHKDRWTKFLKNKELKSHLQSYSSGQCGMHVHISRDSFNGLHLAKFMRFINHKDNKAFMSKIAQRGSNRYTNYEDTSLMNHAKTIHTGGVHHKYAAVNCVNKNTIEVRIFRGNLATVGFLKNLEFVHAVWQYTKDASMMELNYKDFLYWVFDTNNDTRHYKHLKLWLASAGFNISNIQIKRDTDDKTAAKLKDKRKSIKKIQLVINRKYKPKEPTIKFGSRTPISKEEILESA